MGRGGSPSRRLRLCQVERTSPADRHRVPLSEMRTPGVLRLATGRVAIRVPVAACTRMGVIQSMGRVGSALDNAVSESFNSVLKVEYVHRHTFATRTEARLRIATWITGFYNTRRRHSAAGGHPPAVFEQMM